MLLNCVAYDYNLLLSTGRSVAAGKELLAQLKDHNPSGQHSFYSSDVSLLKNVRDVCTLIGNEYKSVNYCVLSQGIASIQVCDLYESLVSVLNFVNTLL